MLLECSSDNTEHSLTKLVLISITLRKGAISFLKGLIFVILLFQSQSYYNFYISALDRLSMDAMLLPPRVRDLKSFNLQR